MQHEYSPLQLFHKRLDTLYNGRNITNIKEPELREFITGLQKDLEEDDKDQRLLKDTIVRQSKLLTTQLQSIANFSDQELKYRQQIDELTQVIEPLLTLYNAIIGRNKTKITGPGTPGSYQRG
jgi:hypothetical protein